jgi:hypothetical protein
MGLGGWSGGRSAVAPKVAVAQLRQQAELLVSQIWFGGEQNGQQARFLRKEGCADCADCADEARTNEQ